MTRRLKTETVRRTRKTPRRPNTCRMTRKKRIPRTIRVTNKMTRSL